MTDVVTQVIESGVCEGNLFHITEKLDRKQYVEVNRFLESHGGKWNKQKKAHVFSIDAEEALQAEATKKNPFSFFTTPESLVRRMVRKAEIMPDATVLEPSAGMGSIVDILLEETPNVHAVEIDPERYKVLSALLPDAVLGDFLTLSLGLYDNVVMNPPFNSEERKDCYIEHVTKAYSLLKMEGRLVSIVPKGIEFRQDKRVADFRSFVLGHGSIESLEGKLFKETGVQVSLIIMNKD